MSADEIVSFVAVADAGTFRGAARVLGVPKTTVSRHVASLEERLGSQLLARTTRSVRLTDAGAAYLRVVGPAVAMLRNAGEVLDEHRTTVRGVLRVSVPVVFGQVYLLPVLTELLARHPQLRLVVDQSDGPLDPVSSGFDVVLRPGMPSGTTLVVRKVADAAARVVASPAYLKARGTPSKPEDLRGHDCLFVAPKPTAAWPFRVKGRTRSIEVSVRAGVSNFGVVHELARAGFGIAWLPSFLADPDVASGRLQVVLARYTHAAMPLYAITAGGRTPSPKVRAFIDVLADVMHRVLPLAKDRAGTAV